MQQDLASGAPAPCPTPFNLAAHVLAGADRHPDRIALQIVGLTGAERWSYVRLAAAVGGVGTGLLALGLIPGDRVLLRLGNSLAFPLAYLGCIAAGLVPVPTSAQLTAPEVARVTATTSPALIIASDGLALPDPAPCPVLTEAALTAMEALPRCACVMGDPDRLAYMVFTSGTTGQPRAVMHAHRAVWARRMMHRGWMGLTAEDRVLHPGAFNWTYTLGSGLLDPWSLGATALIPAPGVDPGQLPLLLKRFDATIFAAAPGVYRQMLRASMPPLPRLRHGLSAGEALPDALRAAWVAATGTPVYEAFGLSECSTFLSGSPDRPAPPGSTGYPQPGRRIAVLDETGQPVPAGTQGVLAVHRNDPGLFLGYFNAPDDTAARFRGDWFVTGDTVQADPDGAVRYLGRDDDMMNAGGYRVSPVEVEEAMLRAPGIAECAAAEVAVRADARVIACFYTSGAPLDEAALARHAAETLARYKQPRLFVRLPALPRGANNKLRRRDLRQDWEAARGQA